MTNNLRYGLLTAFLSVSLSASVLAGNGANVNGGGTKNRDLVLGQGGGVITETALLSGTGVSMAEGGVEYNIADGIVRYSNGDSFDITGAIRIYSHLGGSGHVLCNGGYFTPYERTLIFKRDDGYFVTRTVTAAESQDINNEGASVVCSSGDFNLKPAYVVNETVVASGGSLRCAYGSWNNRLNGDFVPLGPRDQEDFYSDGHYLGSSFVIFEDFTKPRAVSPSGAVTIPASCE